MKPKEKANELVDRFRIILMNEDTDCGNEILCTTISKQCALICVDEIIKDYMDLMNDRSSWEGYKVNAFRKLEYWQEVKQEINAL